MQSKGCMLWFVYVAMLLDNKSIRTHTHILHIYKVYICSVFVSLLCSVIMSVCVKSMRLLVRIFVEDTILFLSLSQWTHTLAIFHLSWMCNAPNSKCESPECLRPDLAAMRGRDGPVEYGICLQMHWPLSVDCSSCWGGSNPALTNNLTICHPLC